MYAMRFFTFIFTIFIHVVHNLQNKHDEKIFVVSKDKLIQCGNYFIETWQVNCF